jgi:hypothetical protein
VLKEKEVKLLKIEKTRNKKNWSGNERLGARLHGLVDA